MTDTVESADEYEDGYPRSSDSDLDPGPSLFESLDEADREVAREQRYAPQDRRPDDSIADETSELTEP